METNTQSPEEETIKQKASKILSQLFNTTEYAVHHIIDQGTQFKNEAEQKIVMAYNQFKEILSELNVKDKATLKPGDLLISPIDIVHPIKNIILVPAGQVFEYTEELIPFIKTDLLEPSKKDLVHYGALKELSHLNSWIKDSIINEAYFGATHIMDQVQKTITNLNSRK